MLSIGVRLNPFIPVHFVYFPKTGTPRSAMSKEKKNERNKLYREKNKEKLKEYREKNNEKNNNKCEAVPCKV